MDKPKAKPNNPHYDTALKYTERMCLPALIQPVGMENSQWTPDAGAGLTYKKHKLTTKREAILSDICSLRLRVLATPLFECVPKKRVIISSRHT